MKHTFLLLLFALSIQSCGGPDDEDITLSEYNSIQTGDSRTRVKDIVGSDGSQQSSSGNMEFRVYDGYGSTGANAVIAYTSGRVTSKAQTGLE